MLNEIHEKHIQIVVDHLIARCRWDAQRCLRAAESARDANLRFFFRKCSGQRQRFSEELSRLARREEDWSEPQEAVRSGNLRTVYISDEGLIRECFEKEQDILHVYQDALEEALPAHLRTILADHATSILFACDYLGNLLRNSTHGLYPQQRVQTDALREH